jgi:hypothetical protein
MSTPITTIPHYRVKPGCEDEFLAIIDRHWPALRELELVTDREPEVFVGAEQGVEGTFVVEVFEWADADASARAHQHPAVSEIWESMGPLCESRGGRPPFEFPNFRRAR